MKWPKPFIRDIVDSLFAVNAVVRCDESSGMLINIWYWDAYGNVMMKMDVCLSKSTCGEFSMEELMSIHK